VPLFSGCWSIQHGLRRRSAEGGKMKIRRINALLLVAVFVSFLPFELAFGEGDLQRQTVMQGSIERTFYVHYPKNRHPAVPKALVFVLHGGGGADARTMANRTGMNEIADREDFMVIYPAGIDGQWNDGRGKSFRRTKDNTDVDDVGFISALIDLFVKKGEADSARIYVMGLSNGGMMTHRLGIELGKKLAAIAPVLSTDKTVRYWVAAAQLPLKPETRYLDDVSRSDKCTVEVDRYSAAGRRTEVVLYRIRGGGHNLPGGNTPDRPRLLGPKCMDISGSEAIWSFFKKYSRAKRIASAGQ